MNIDELIIKYPEILSLQSYRPFLWTNPHQNYAENLRFTITDIEDAENRFQRFAPFITEAFPETVLNKGIIESPLVEIRAMKAAMAERIGCSFSNHDRLFLKCDHALPISGSIKARGGIYEVLKYAETLAIQAGLLRVQDNYRCLTEEKFKRFFSDYSLAVGSTGNLGLSVGIMGRKLGFNVEVHMSTDAKKWKKELLRSVGATVYEHSGDFTQAVAQGREQAKSNEKMHFIDDEYSTDLFLGYAVAAFRLKKQIAEQNISVDAEHPLAVIIPCGVGGAPSGITFGLKQIFGKNVRCFTAEPTHAPAMLLGLMTELWDQISVKDVGIDGITAADGLAVGRPSKLACEVLDSQISGCFTVTDDDLFKYLALLANTEKIQVEPSASAGFGGFDLIRNRFFTTFDRVNYIVWSTGGGMVPPTEMTEYIKRGNRSFR